MPEGEKSNLMPWRRKEKKKKKGWLPFSIFVAGQNQGYMYVEGAFGFLIWRKNGENEKKCFFPPQTIQMITLSSWATVHIWLGSAQPKCIWLMKISPKKMSLYDRGWPQSKRKKKKEAFDDLNHRSTNKCERSGLILTAKMRLTIENQFRSQKMYEIAGDRSIANMCSAWFDCSVLFIGWNEERKMQKKKWNKNNKLREKNNLKNSFSIRPHFKSESTCPKNVNQKDKSKNCERKKKNGVWDEFK